MTLDPMEVVKKFEGFAIKQAEAIAHMHNWEVRVVREDGEEFVCTADYINTRVNVAVENGVITEVIGIG